MSLKAIFIQQHKYQIYIIPGHIIKFIFHVSAFPNIHMEATFHVIKKKKQINRNNFIFIMYLPKKFT